MSKRNTGDGDAGENNQRQQDSVSEHQSDIGLSAKRDPNDSKRAGGSWEKWVAIGSLVTNILIFVAGVLGWLVIRDQLREMEKANQQTERASIEGGKADERRLAAMERTNELTALGIDESKRQAEAALIESARQAAASLELARQTLEESKRSLVEQQRARLGLFGIDGIDLGDGTAPFNIVAKIFNNGNAAATDISWKWSVQFIRGTDRPVPPTGGEGPGSVSVIMGGAAQAIVRRVGPWGAGRIEAIRNRTGFLYVLGTTSYLDGFGNRRRLDHCNVYDPDTNTWVVCSFGNYAD